MTNTVGIAAQLPLAAGTVPGCYHYYNYFRPAIIEQSQPHEAIPRLSQSKCEPIADNFGVHVEELLKWNPSLSRDGCVLQPGFSYCVVKTRNPKTWGLSPSKAVSSDPPICTFDPKKGEYVCPDPPTCTFNPQKGEYICPATAPTVGVESEHNEEGSELKEEKHRCYNCA